VQNTIKGAIAIVAVSAAVGCSQRPAGSGEFSAAVTAPTSPSLAASTGGTMKEALTGPAEASPEVLTALLAPGVVSPLAVLSPAAVERF